MATLNATTQIKRESTDLLFTKPNGFEVRLRKVYTLRDLKANNETAEQYFFSPKTLRFFHSRISERIFQDTANKDAFYFVTSERFSSETPRLFTIRKATLRGAKIDTVGDFQDYRTLGTALRHAKKLAEQTI